MSPSIVWFRHDLRVEDNPALHAAIEHGGPVVPLFVWAPEEEGHWAPGAATRWWLHHSLVSLHNDLRERGVPLVVRRGGSLEELQRVIASTGADAVFWNRRYEPAVIDRDTLIKDALTKQGIRAEGFNGSLLFEPWEIENKQGRPYQVFSQFWKECRRRDEPGEPLPAPERIVPLTDEPESATIDDLSLLPTIDWAAGLRETWSPGTAEAHDRLERFLDEAVPEYKEDRNRPDRPATSKLSPHIRHGEISPRTIWHATKRRMQTGVADRGADHFLFELGWREFAYHLLYHFPYTSDIPLREKFAAFPWESNPSLMRSWQRGRTGFPFVDAGMRELWTTGWMHNRARMVVASFLTKDLRLSWLDGARWFWDTLVDADLASNTLGWQWSAGCGADAAPYFRIFNPTTQGEKFDPDGEYTRRWLPELDALTGPHVHSPAKFDTDLYRTADYPRPIVDHAEARKIALSAFDTIKGR